MGNAHEWSEEITLTILKTIEENAGVTQRKLAQEHQVSLGNMNIILRRLMNKGFVKITAVHPKRFLYFLTPRGINEKTRLTLSYVSKSIQIYKNVKNHVEQTLEEMIRNGWDSVELCGVDDGFDIVYLAAMDKGLKIAGIYDFNIENVGRHKFGFDIQDAKGLGEGKDEKALPVLIASIANEPLLRRRLKELVRESRDVYSIV